MIKLKKKELPRVKKRKKVNTKVQANQVSTTWNEFSSDDIPF